MSEEAINKIEQIPKGKTNKIGEISNSFCGWARSVVSTVIKGIILLCWIYCLAFLAMVASYKSVASLIFNLFDQTANIAVRDFYIAPDPISKQPQVNYELDKRYELKKFVFKRYKEKPPPIESVMDSIFGEIGWTVRDPDIPDNVNNKHNRKRQEYERLFNKIAIRLESFADDNSIDAKLVRIKLEDVVPSSFIKSFDDINKEITLPTEAINWIDSQRDFIAERQSRSELIDTFALLISLGAFGSLIFLIRDYVVSEVQLSIRAYIFRPLLGIFLAVSVFVIDIAAHTVISEANILSIRNETLYLLAFAAGLLSEPAYKWIGQHAERAFKDEEKQVG